MEIDYIAIKAETLNMIDELFSNYNTEDDIIKRYKRLYIEQMEFLIESKQFFEKYRCEGSTFYNSFLQISKDNLLNSIKFQTAEELFNQISIKINKIIESIFKPEIIWQKEAREDE